MDKIILTTPEMHTPTCPKSGKEVCRDVLHRKTDWTREDLNLLSKILDNYLNENRQVR